jgi:hypothetical protein
MSDRHILGYSGRTKYDSTWFLFRLLYKLNVTSTDRALQYDHICDFTRRMSG